MKTPNGLACTRHEQNIVPPPSLSAMKADTNRLRNLPPPARLALLTLLCCALLPALTGCRTRSFLSTKQEVALGKEGSREVEQQFRVDTTSADAERVRRVGTKLISHMDRRDVPYSFKVLDAKEINAFSLPGGPVYVYRGLLDMMGDDDDALACVLGHEGGHVNARHVARHISSSILNNLVIDIFIPNPVAAEGAGLLTEVMGLKYSREDEYEADRRGLSYAHFAGYNPEGMIRFFGKLERLEKRQGGGDPEWMRDHPLTEARIEKAQAIIDHNDFRYGQ
jgi:beta-barrel assembly-enhancing protease